MLSIVWEIWDLRISFFCFFFHFFSIFASFLLHFCRTPPRTPDLGRTRELRRSSADLLCSWRVLPTPADVDFFLHRHRMRRFVEFRFESTVHSRFRSSSSEFAAQVGAVQICCSSRRSVLKILTIQAVTGFFAEVTCCFCQKVTGKYAEVTCYSDKK